MKRTLLLFVALLLAAGSAGAATRYVAADGNWTASIWNDDGCGQAADASAAPTSSDDVVLCPNVTVTVPCNTNAQALTITDGGTWTTTTTGGFVMDGSACTAGQVPTLRLYSTDGHASIRLDGQSGTPDTFQATRSQRFVVKGRTIESGVWGEPSDLTQNCGGSDRTVANGGSTLITYESAKEECTLWTWAGYPYFNNKPTVANFPAGTIIYFTSGWYKGNFAHVARTGGSVAANTLEVGFGDPDDMFGSQAAWTGPAALPDPGGAVANHKSLQTYIDVTVSGVTTTSDNRQRVTIQTGALQAIPGGGSDGAMGVRAGQCLITYGSTASARKYYRIAGTIDGGGSNDQLILDPFDSLAAADRTGFSYSAWVGPCVRPGDSFVAIEPAVIRPGTVSTSTVSHQVSIHLLGGQCPEISEAWIAHYTHGLDTYNATDVWAGLSNPGFAMFGAEGCTPFLGPTAMGPGHGAVTSPFTSSGYAFYVAAAENVTVSDLSINGYYNTVSNSSQNHGIAFFDVKDLTIEDSNVSFINNDGIYMATQVEECAAANVTCESDHTAVTGLTDWEGATVTVRNNTIHDLIQHASSNDNGAAIAFQVNQTLGKFSLLADGNVMWNIDASIMLFPNSNPTAAMDARVVNNVIGAAARAKGASGANQYGVDCNTLASDIVVANNIFLPNPDYNSEDTYDTFSTRNCRRAIYNFFGEAGTTAYLAGTGTGQQDQVFSGNLLEGGGAYTVIPSGASPNPPTTSTSSRIGIDLSRQTGYDGTVYVENNTLRRFCGMFTDAGTKGINLQGSTDATYKPTYLLRNNSLGMYCSEITGAGNTPAGASSAAFLMQGANAMSDINTASRIANNLMVTGDLFVDSASDAYNTGPIFIANAPTATSFTLSANVCSESGSGGYPASSYACCIAGANCGNANLTKDGLTGPSVDLEGMYAPDRPLEALGIRSPTDLRLKNQSIAYYMGPSTAPIGAGYSGISKWDDAFENLDLPPAFFFQRNYDGAEPIRSLIPATILGLVLDNAMAIDPTHPGILKPGSGGM